jgi:hypothetical protein
MKAAAYVGERERRAVPVLAIAAALVSANVHAAPLSFKGAELGMTLAEWRSLAPPEGAGPDAVPACADDPRIVALAHNPLSATMRRSDGVACAYLDLFGDTALPHSIHLEANYRADHLQYRFVHGRLAEIRFMASIDAYSNLMTMLEHQYGPPSETMRDTAPAADSRFARVIQTWRSPAGDIVLADPSDEPTELRVSLSASSANDPRPAIASALSGAGGWR